MNDLEKIVAVTMDNIDAFKSGAADRETVKYLLMCDLLLVFKLGGKAYESTLDWKVKQQSLQEKQKDYDRNRRKPGPKPYSILKNVGL